MLKLTKRLIHVSKSLYKKVVIVPVKNVLEAFNIQNPIWMRKPKEITKEEYTTFYRSLTKVGGNNLSVKHFSMEDELEIKIVLFVPKRYLQYFPIIEYPNILWTLFEVGSKAVKGKGNGRSNTEW